MLSCTHFVFVKFSLVIFLQTTSALYVYDHYSEGVDSNDKDESSVDDGFTMKPLLDARSVNRFSDVYQQAPTIALTDNQRQQGFNDTDEHVSSELLNHRNWPLLNQVDQCGLRKLALEKSMGGKDAALAEYPWMAQLIFLEQHQTEDNETYEVEAGECGGSIITQRYVLTAAHCCTSNLVYVRLGEYDRHHVKDCRKGICAPPPIILDVENKIVHRGFNLSVLINDICLIRLSEDIKFTDYVQPICLPTSDSMREDQFIGASTTVTGWGSLENYPRMRLPAVLQEVQLQIRPGKNCTDEYFPRTFDWDVQICAGGSLGHNPCPGDSGGPLMYRSPVDQRQYVLGIVSAGWPCSHSLMPSSDKTYSVLFTRVSAFTKWILDNIYA